MNRPIEFNDILDECLENLLIKGGTVEQCLESYPGNAEELRPLLETIMASQQAVNIRPDSEFRNRARNELQAALQEKEFKKSRSLFNWGRQPRWATAAVTAVLVIVLAGGGTAAAASGSMPDSFLYPVKRAAEQVQLAFTFSSLGKAERYADLADKRIEEIIYLADNNKPEEIGKTTEILDEHLTQVAILSTPVTVTMLESAPLAPEAGVPEIMSVEEAETESADAPPPTKDAAEKAVVAEEAPTAVQSRDMPVSEAAPAPATTGVNEDLTDDPRTELKNKVAEQAGKNLERLRALLETAPESAKAALMRAIAVSEAAYMRALESLQ